MLLDPSHTYVMGYIYSVFSLTLQLDTKNITHKCVSYIISPSISNSEQTITQELVRFGMRCKALGLLLTLDYLSRHVIS